MKMHKTKGFTIIEMLVALAIIAILFSAVLALTGDAKQKARDSQRLSDVREIAKSLAIYAVDTGNFPVQTTAITITGTDAVSTALESEEAISETPTDPIHPTHAYTYQSSPNGDTYIISFCLETNTIENYSQGCGNTITP